MFNFRRWWLFCGAVLVVASCSSTAAPKSYSINDVGPAGGIIFITPSTPGNRTGLYFEVARLPSEVNRRWATGVAMNLSVPGARRMAIGDGAANTAAIASQAGNVAESSAAVYASEYSVNGFSDWFLPSKDELFELYDSQVLIVEMLQLDKDEREISEVYWSSSEDDADSSWNQGFSGILRPYPRLSQGSQWKYALMAVRPVRAFD